MTTLTTFRSRLEQILAPAGNRDWSDNALDEALRQARDRYGEVLPPREIDTVTLTTDGREIDVSSLTYTGIERVWWDYDTTDPNHPPNWRDFEVWSGDIVYIYDDDEPESGDVVRFWLIQRPTIQNLDSATETNIPTEHDTLLLTGAAAYAAQSLVSERTEQPNISDWLIKNLSEWADKKLHNFEARLQQMATQRALDDGGLAPQPPLDTYDNEWS
jgi:hypothetical protein